MPIPSFITDSMLGAFRSMMATVEQQNLEGEDVQEMRKILGRMEQLAQEMDDLGAYSNTLGAENLFMQFSQAYSSALASAAQTASGQGISTYNDATLLQQTLAAYRNSLLVLPTGQEYEEVRKALQQIIAYGESGVSYPRLLKAMIENGWEKALEGTVATRESLVGDWQYAQSEHTPWLVRKTGAILDLFDALATEAPWRVPEPFVFAQEKWKIEQLLKVDENRYKHQCGLLWEGVYRRLHDWIDAFTRHAPNDIRYRGATPAETQDNIDFHQACNPILLHEVLQVLEKDYGFTWQNKQEFETYTEEPRSRRFTLTSDFVAFLESVFPHCLPGGMPSEELIRKAELFIEGHGVYKKSGGTHDLEL